MFRTTTAGSPSSSAQPILSDVWRHIPSTAAITIEAIDVIQQSNGKMPCTRPYGYRNSIWTGQTNYRGSSCDWTTRFLHVWSPIDNGPASQTSAVPPAETLIHERCTHQNTAVRLAVNSTLGKHGRTAIYVIVTSFLLVPAVILASKG